MLGKSVYRSAPKQSVVRSMSSRLGSVDRTGGRTGDSRGGEVARAIAMVA